MTPRKFFTIKEKVEVLNFNKTNKFSVRKLADKFKAGKSQIADILKNKVEILKSYRENDIGENTRRVVFRGATGTGGAIIDKAVLEWFRRARDHRMPISGPIIQSKALEFAQEIGDTAFKASNGWLERFRNRHNIKFKVMGGESRSVNDANVKPENNSLNTIDILESVQESVFLNQIEEEIVEDSEKKIELDTSIKNYSEGLETIKKLKDFYERNQDIKGYSLIYKVMVYHEKKIVNSKKNQTELNHSVKKE